MGALGRGGLLTPRTTPLPRPSFCPPLLPRLQPTARSPQLLFKDILTLKREDQRGEGPSRAGPATSHLLFVASSGCLGTAAALTYGLYCFHRGQSQRSQLMMRTRIAAQGFTIVAILVGLAASTLKSRP